MLVAVAEFTQISEQVKASETWKDKYLTAKPIHVDEKTSYAHIKEKVACKMLVLKEMAAFVRNSKETSKANVEKQRRQIAALLELRKNWNLIQEKTGLALYLGNNRYGLSDVRVTLTAEDPLKYQIPGWIQVKQVLEVQLQPEDLCSQLRPTPLSELELADAYCRDKALFEEMTAVASSCEEFRVISKAAEELVVDAVTAHVMLTPRFRFVWREYSDMESDAKRLLVELWRKRRDEGKTDTLKLFIAQITHRQVLQYALNVRHRQTLYQVFSRYDMKYTPFPQFLEGTHTQFHVYNGIRQVCLVDVQQTQVSVGFCSHILLQIGDSVLAGVPPGVLRPVSLAELSEVMEMSVVSSQQQLIGK